MQEYELIACEEAEGKENEIAVGDHAPRLSPTSLLMK